MNANAHTATSIAPELLPMRPSFHMRFVSSECQLTLARPVALYSLWAQEQQAPTLGRVETLNLRVADLQYPMNLNGSGGKQFANYRSKLIAMTAFLSLSGVSHLLRGLETDSQLRLLDRNHVVLKLSNSSQELVVRYAIERQDLRLFLDKITDLAAKNMVVQALQLLGGELLNEDTVGFSGLLRHLLVWTFAGWGWRVPSVEGVRAEVARHTEEGLWLHLAETSGAEPHKAQDSVQRSWV